MEINISFVNKILSWYSMDFGKSETEVMKFVAKYGDPSKSENLGLLNSN